MAKEATERIGLAHGAAHLPAVDVLSYNVELKDDEGFVGDRASKGAVKEFIENWRKPLRKILAKTRLETFPQVRLPRRSSTQFLPKASRRVPE